MFCERQGPSMGSVNEILTDNISAQISGDRSGDNKIEDMCIIRII